MELNKCRKCGYQPASVVDSVRHDIEDECKSNDNNMMTIKCYRGHNVIVSKSCYNFAKKNKLPLAIYCKECEKRYLHD